MNEPPDALGASLAELVDHICDRFEEGWLAGSPPAVDQLVRAAPEPVRARLFRELLAVEREYRARAGRPVTPEEARDRFGGCGPWAEEVFREWITPTGSWVTPGGPEGTLPASPAAPPGPSGRDPVVPIPVAVRVAREVAEGLAAAAAAGLVHRDVKPGNVWLEGEPTAADPARRVRRVKVLDFGLARAVDRSDGISVPGSVVGTPAYMAPEQADGQEVDARADLFSLG